MVIHTAGQSSDQNFPSPVTQSEIGASIRARDVGDARLTTHFWAFDGSQGDIFINVVTQNFSGDIDVYQASDLKPLTKMVMFADNGTSETGRVIYMRQPARLLLRVQGRTPNDDPASYKIKFAGSFVALAPEKQDRPPEVGSLEDTGVKVNSVGTIVALNPKPSVTRETEPAETKPPMTGTSASERSSAKEASQPPSHEPVRNTGRPAVKTVFGNNSAKETTTKTPPATANSPARKAGPRSKTDVAADPLTGVSLVIMLKDGARIERPMSEVIRFMFDHGALTIFVKDGSIHRVAAADILSVTVR